jgi:hypothetical protein
MEVAIDKEVQIDLPKIDKYYLNIILFIGIFLTSLILVTLRFTKYKDDEKYKHFFDDFYHDFVKYLLIEGFLVIFESINAGKYHLTSALGRISIVQVALLIFHIFKERIGIV